MTGWSGYVSSGLRTGFKSSISGCYPPVASRCMGTVTERNAWSAAGGRPGPRRCARLATLAAVHLLTLMSYSVACPGRVAPGWSRPRTMFRSRNYARAPGAPPPSGPAGPRTRPVVPPPWPLRRLVRTQRPPTATARPPPAHRHLRGPPATPFPSTAELAGPPAMRPIQRGEFRPAGGAFLTALL